ncbi:MAG: GNAT family N-acetyltransferase [Deltaproteobacteria bacterium]|nr:GNAT family N-acetyltransferase [Deltaproteobacteria bacterium]
MSPLAVLIDVLIVRPLQPSDNRSTFRSGHIELDRFFQRYAGQNQFRHHLGTTWVAVDDGVIVGFVTVSAAHLELGVLPERLRRKLPAYPLPVLRLARLAVAENTQGRGIGRALLRAAFALAWRMADEVGCTGVVVDAKAEAVAFYERLGFFALAHAKGGLGDRPEPTPLFLELAAIPRTVERDNGSEPA